MTELSVGERNKRGTEIIEYLKTRYRGISIIRTLAQIQSGKFSLPQKQIDKLTIAIEEEFPNQLGCKQARLCTIQKKKVFVWGHIRWGEYKVLDKIESARRGLWFWIELSNEYYECVLFDSGSTLSIDNFSEEALDKLAMREGMPTWSEEKDWLSEGGNLIVAEKNKIITPPPGKKRYVVFLNDDGNSLTIEELSRGFLVSKA